MKNYIALILQFLATTAIVYAAISFIELSANFREWPYSRRLALIVASLILTFIIRSAIKPR